VQSREVYFDLLCWNYGYLLTLVNLREKLCVFASLRD